MAKWRFPLQIARRSALSPRLFPSSAVESVAQVAHSLWQLAKIVELH